jgi:MFS transporter, MFS domain-containing protein family, molybdate-anion transporter
VTITTKDFKSFQLNFLFGYMAAIFGEVLCVATFYQVLVASQLTMHQITKLFIVSVSSSTLLGVIAEMIDLGSRRDKCVLSMILYFVASVSLYVSNYEILLLGRIVYGGGSVLLHSAFDAYMVHEHTTQGFPDDWLLQTFGKLAHAMTVVAMSAGFHRVIRT